MFNTFWSIEMTKFLVSFTLPSGEAHVRRVEALTAMIAIRIAHDLVTHDATLREATTIVCTKEE